MPETRVTIHSYTHSLPSFHLHPVCDSPFKHPITLRAVAASNPIQHQRSSLAVKIITTADLPVVGSSRIRIFGASTSSIPMHARFRSPPDTPRTNSVPTFVSAHPCRPRSTMIFSTRSRLSSLVTSSDRRTFAENMRFSRTVNVPLMMSSCTTYPTRYLYDAGSGYPSTSTSPSSPRCSFRSARMSKSDDLPHPVGPVVRESKKGGSSGGG